VRTATKPTRAPQGETTDRVINTIRELEAQQHDWNEHSIAERCALSVQHARNILKALTFNGTLKFQDNVVVKKTRLVLSDSAKRAA
jgi:hypothetical protein